jgi:hypothetical protein
MSSRPAASLSHPHDELGVLLALLAGYRLRLGAEVLLRFSLRGLIAGALLLIGVSVVDWLLELRPQSTWLWAALVLPTLGGVGVALAWWPSHGQTARASDRRLQLDERVGTAVELGSARRMAPSGRFDRLQLQDAIAQLREAPRRWPSLAASARRELWIGLGVSLVAAASLLLPSVPRPRFETAADVPAAVEAATEERQAPAEMLELPAVDSASIAQQSAETELAPRVQQAQAQQEALDRLAQALGQVSAGQPAADAMQRGDFGDARSQLATLGEEADQLSDAAKKQLAQALQAAAAASGGDRQLADRERQAAAALSRNNNYADQRNALRQLADQVERSGARSLPAAQLARDAGRLQQQQQRGSSGGQSPGTPGQAPASSSIRAQQGGDMTNGGPGGQSQTGTEAGEQGGVGAGTGTTDGVGDPSGRLATSGQKVEVPAKLGSGPGERPPDGTEEQVGTNPDVAARTVAEAAHTQQTGQVAPEQNLVPGEQRPVVRGYFR